MGVKNLQKQTHPEGQGISTTRLQTNEDIELVDNTADPLSLQHKSTTKNVNLKRHGSKELRQAPDPQTDYSQYKLHESQQMSRKYKKSKQKRGKPSMFLLER